MEDYARNATALFIFGLYMVSISPVFSYLLDFEPLLFISSFLSNFFNLETLRWGPIAIGFLAILFGVLTIFYNWKRK